MATRYNQDNYAYAKGKKNEPLSKLISHLKKQKNTDGFEVVILTPIQPSLPSSPIMSLEELTSPPRTRAKREEKMEQSVWADPTTSFGRAHKVITEDKLKALSSVLSHKLVSCHIHKMLQVLGESLHLTTDYLVTKEKVVMARSKAKVVEAKYSTLRI